MGLGIIANFVGGDAEFTVAALRFTQGSLTRDPSEFVDCFGSRDVAQSGSAPEWGSGGRGFKSRRPDCVNAFYFKWIDFTSPKDLAG